MRMIRVAVVACAIAPCLVAACGGGRDRATSNLSGAGGGAGSGSPDDAGAGVGGGAVVGTGGGAVVGTGGGAVVGTGGGAVGTGAAGAAGGAGTGAPPTPQAHGCSDLFDPSVLVDYAVDISPDELAKMDYEFRNVEALKAAGQDYKPYHPVVFHYGAETVADAMIRLKGDSSWRNTVRNDADKAKMQFVISFEEVNTSAKFHGVSKVVLDMPDNDSTFIQERLGFTVLAEMLAMPAPCANSARMTINGQYYGLYTNEEDVGHSYIKRVFPEAPDGDLFEGGYTAKTNKLAPNTARQSAFWAAHDIGAMAAVVDIDASVAEWAAEALLNDSDGYYGGGHNFYIYDYPGLGYRWLIDDADATFAWIGRSDLSPIYWWAGRSTQQTPGQHYLIVMTDPPSRAKYVAALRALLARWDVARVQGWIDAFAAQTADAVAADPHLLRTVAQHNQAVAAMRQEVADRPAVIARFLACQDGSGDASDVDGDGFAWCNDCDDGNAAVNPGAAEICGNGIDDNCTGLATANDACTF